MIWLYSLLGPITYIFFSITAINFFDIEKNIISFLVLGIVPVTNIQLNFYLLSVILLIIFIIALFNQLLKRHKLSHIYKLLTSQQEHFRKISI